MGTQLRNEAQVRRYLLPKIQNVVEYLLDKIYGLNEETIDRVVYAAYNPTKYKRTGEFKKSWTYETPKMSGIHVSGEFKYDPKEMEYNAEEAQHGSPDWYSGRKSGDARKYLAEIIYQGTSGVLFGFGPWMDKRDAWSALLDELDGDRVCSWANVVFAKEGLNVKLNSSQLRGNMK